MLRVISGTAKGHKLKTLSGMATRPTSNKVREAIFNIIAADLIDKDVLDLFAGTGSLGIEALSRGAKRAVFIDNSRECCKIISENLKHTKLADYADVYAVDYAFAIEKLFKKNRRFDIIFLDPPYNKKFIQETLKLLTKNDIMKYSALVIAEHDVSDKLPTSEGSLKAVDIRKYGNTMVTIYMKQDFIEKDNNR